MFKFEKRSHIGQAGLLIVLSQSPECWCHRGTPHAEFYSVLRTNARVLCILGVPEGFVPVAVIKTMTKTNRATLPASPPRAHFLASLPPFTLSLSRGLGTVALAGLELVLLLSRPHSVGVSGVCT